MQSGIVANPLYSYTHFCSGNMQRTFLVEPSADFNMMEKSADIPVGYIQNLSQDINLDCLVMNCSVVDSLKEAEPSKGWAI